MMRNNIFLKDVDVPKIVQKKADNAFLTIKMERNCIMKKEQNGEISKLSSRMVGKKLAKVLVVTAACAALVVTGGAFTGSLKGILGNFGSGKTEIAQNSEDDTILTAIDKIDKMFTLQVKAADTEEGELVSLVDGHPVPTIIGDDKAGSWILGANDEDDSVNYCINIPELICKGDHIESVTYSINNGAFQIVQPENQESIIVEGKLYEGTLNTGSVGGDNNEENDGQPSRPFETVLYKSFTVNYDKQSDPYTWLNICNTRPDSDEIKQLIWKEGGTEEEYNSGIQKMLDNTIITCTVNYTDHTSQSVNIKVDSHIMTRKEAGEPCDPGMDPQQLEEEMTVITFELQSQTDTQ